MKQLTLFQSFQKRSKYPVVIAEIIHSFLPNTETLFLEQRLRFLVESKELITRGTPRTFGLISSETPTTQWNSSMGFPSGILWENNRSTHKWNSATILSKSKWVESFQQIKKSIKQKLRKIMLHNSKIAKKKKKNSKKRKMIYLFQFFKGRLINLLFPRWGP